MNIGFVHAGVSRVFFYNIFHEWGILSSGGGVQSDKKVLPSVHLFLNFITFSRIAMFGKIYPFKGISW